MKENKLWLIALCFVIAGAASVCCWQQLQAQGPTAPGGAVAPGGVASTPTAPMGAPAAATTAPVAAPAGEPTIGIGAVMPGGASTVRVKNWDGKVTEMKRFRYKTMDNRIITVHLPASYRTEKLTRAGWDTLFKVYGMDKEAALDADAKRVPEISSEQLQQLIGQMTHFANRASADLNQMPTAPVIPMQPYNPAAGAADFARSNLPSMGMQLPPMAPMTPMSGVINP